MGTMQTRSTEEVTAHEVTGFNVDEYYPLTRLNI